jgi:hypothetical protein
MPGKYGWARSKTRAWERRSKRGVIAVPYGMVGRRKRLMPHTFPSTAQPALMVGRTPWSAADAPVGLRSMDEVDFLGEKRP